MRLRSELRPKSKKTTPKRLSKEQEEAFIAQNASVEAGRIHRDNPRKRVITGRGRPAAPGYHRTSMDLPEELYRKAKYASIETGLTLREIVAEALILWLEQKED